MLKIDKKISLLLSYCMAALVCAALLFLIFYMPTLAGKFERIMESSGAHAAYTTFEKVLVLVCGYLAIALGLLGDTLLFFVLHNAGKGKIFTSRSVLYVRGISWCLILIGVLFFVLTPLCLFLLPVGFAFFAVGTCLRVVKNALEEGTDLKNENDMTI